MEVALLFAMVIGLLLIGVPIAVSLGLSSIIFLLIYSDGSLGSIAQTLFSAFDGHATLLAIPFFILASAFMSTGGVAKRIIQFAIASVGHFRGGLAIASVFACMLFAALSGSSPATVVAVGSIVIAGMRQVGYSKEFAAGVICNAGTLGILIPPSIVMVVYAAATDVSVGRMFLAGVIPGLLAGLLLMIAIYIAATIKNMPREPKAGWGRWFRTMGDAAWGLFLIVIILGGIYGGIFTPTEAAAVAAVYAFFIANFVYCDMGPLSKFGAISGKAGAIAIGSGIAAFLIVWVGVTIFFGNELGSPFGWAGISGFGLVIVFLLLGSILRASAGNPLKFIGNSIFIPLATTIHPDTKKVLFDAAKLTTTLMFIIANALILKHVLTEEQIPQHIAAIMLEAGYGPIMFLVIVNVMLLIGGQFMEPSGLLIIVAPLVFPIAMQLGIDPIHLGIIMVVNMEIGMITPPVGLNLFVTAGVARMSVMGVVKAALPFVAVLFVFLILITYVPIISTAVPDCFMGQEIIQGLDREYTMFDWCPGHPDNRG